MTIFTRCGNKKVSVANKYVYQMSDPNHIEQIQTNSCWDLVAANKKVILLKNKQIFKRREVSKTKALLVDFYYFYCIIQNK